MHSDSYLLLQIWAMSLTQFYQTKNIAHDLFGQK